MGDGLLSALLGEFPAVLVVGPRACGKTTTALRHARSVIRLDRESEAVAVRADPDGALDMPRPLLIDEWQLAPAVLGAVKRVVDDRPGPGAFVITGSVRTDMTAQGWPLTGRALRLVMYGLTEREIEGHAAATSIIDRIGAIGVDALTAPTVALTLDGYLQRAVRGGFPDAVIASSETMRRRWLTAYVEQLLRRDVDMADPGRDPVRLDRYLRAICANSAGVVADSAILESAGINRETASSYGRLLTNLFAIEEVPAWWTNRLKRLVQLRKRYVVDTGVLAAVLGVTARSIRAHGDLLGRVLDTFVMAQLRAEAAVSEAQPGLFHLRTQEGRHEIDILLEFGGGEVFGIEVKASGAPGRRDAVHLEWLRDQLGSAFIGGVVLHTGPRLYPLADRIVAAPMSSLWSTPRDPAVG
ncbi:MAG: ATP-binding protein [Actinobacteria bacterium 69-20]|nr:ATP-binding protein [Actinomycetota bacterium]OJV31312.1 MAG: ATP-binding protein [Actinobacteria bacterium 69-20]